MAVMTAGMFGLLFPYLLDRITPLWPFIVGGVFFVFGLGFPTLLHPIFRVWMFIGGILGAINARILMTVAFFIMVIPMGLIRKLSSKDRLGLKLDKELKSYRIQHHASDAPHAKSPEKYMDKPF